MTSEMTQLKNDAKELACRYLVGSDLAEAQKIIDNDFLPLGTGKEFLHLISSKRNKDLDENDRAKLKDIAYLLGL